MSLSKSKLRLILAVVMLLLLIVVIVQNSASVQLSLIGFSLNLPVYGVVLASFSLGFLAGWFFRRFRR